MEQPGPIRSAMGVFADRLDELETLL
jgi:hypothetical protein